MLKLRAVSECVPFKIALLDYCMSDVDGESLGLQIKADPQLKCIILVMFTSLSQRGDADRFKKLGFDAYLLFKNNRFDLQDCIHVECHEPYVSDSRVLYIRCLIRFKDGDVLWSVDY